MPELIETSINHPCYNPMVARKIGRLHLPVATKCNVQCNYCNRNFDCPNENRPGVCSKIITVNEIKDYVTQALIEHPEIRIVGIAGPAEPMANLDIFYNTYSTVKKYFPLLKLCLATNGLVLADNINLIKELNIDFITITINSLNIKSITKIYQWIEYNNRVFYNQQVGKILLTQHFKALESLKSLNINYKINSVLIPGINDNDIIEIAKLASFYNAQYLNIIPLISVFGTNLFHSKFKCNNDIENVRKKCSQYIKILTHCQLCRSDAKGFVSKN